MAFVTSGKPERPRPCEDRSIEAAHTVVPATRLTVGGAPESEACEVAVETILLLEVEGVGRWHLSTTPCDLEALAVGFAFGEGLLQGVRDVEGIQVEATGRNTHRLSLRLCRSTGRACPTEPAAFGAAGARDRRPPGEGPTEPPVTTTLRLSSAEVLGLHRRMVERQRVFRRTGGAHAAALFGPGGEEVAFAEDIGRSNAFDKAIGRCLLSGCSPVGCGVVVSGRISFDLVFKAACAGLELVSGVSAPFDLAIEFARARRITLMGFARENRVTIFTHPGRITDSGCEPFPSG